MLYKAGGTKRKCLTSVLIWAGDFLPLMLCVNPECLCEFTPSNTKVNAPYAITLLNWTSLIECDMARLVMKNDSQKDTCCDEIALCSQNIDTILR